MIYVTLVYAPIAAWLVELFPSRIRYSGLSLPYHIGNGWFGGFLPATVFAIVAATGNIYSGLWYPVGIAVMSLIIGFLFLPETKDVDIRQDLRLHWRAAGSHKLVKTGRGVAPRPVLHFRLAAPMNCSTISRRCGRRAMLDQVDRLPGSQARVRPSAREYAARSPSAWS